MKDFVLRKLIYLIHLMEPRISIFYNDKHVPHYKTGISIGAFFSPSFLLFKGKAKEESSYVTVTYDDGGDVMVEKATFRNNRWHVNQGNRIVDYDEPPFDFMAYIPIVDSHGVSGIVNSLSNINT